MKNCRTIICLTAACLLTLAAAVPAPARAQTRDQARELLQQASRAYAQAGGVSAAFRIQPRHIGGQAGEEIAGSILLKGNKFKLDVPDEMITWFDGRNQWLYIIAAEEVNLSNPDEEELLMINPVNVFQLWQHGFRARYAGEKTLKGKPVKEVVLEPEDAQSDIQSLTIDFDKATCQPRHIVIANKDRSGSVIDITQYQPHQDYPDQLFVFPQKEYPTASVIDLR